MTTTKTISVLISEQVETLERLAQDHRKRHAGALGAFDDRQADIEEKQLYAVIFAISQLHSFERNAKRFLTN